MGLPVGNHPWDVLLIGGNSGAGKTVLAQQLAGHLSLSLLLMDDLRVALQQATRAETHPELHVFLQYRAEQWRDPQAMLADWITVSEAMFKPLKAVVSHHVVVPGAGRLIIEGDGIAPGQAAQLIENRRVRAVFLVERDEAQLLQNLQARGRGFNDSRRPERESFARASRLYGQWLGQETQKFGLPVIDAQPRETVFERLLAAISG